MHSSIPFSEIFSSFAHLARQRLEANAGDAFQLLSKQASAALEQQLMNELADLSARAIQLEFSIFRASRQTSIARVLEQSSVVPDDRDYRGFVDHMREGGLVAFLREYSVLARLLETKIDLWVEANTEFLKRLEHDWQAIDRTFNLQPTLRNPQSAICNLQSRLSDPHHRSRTVIGVTLTDGTRLIYKPRNLGMERAYFTLLDWLNHHNVPLDFKVLQMLDRGTHGWVEFVEPHACDNTVQSRRYLQRAGMLLCLMYTLEGTDGHVDNVIASGEYPVLVDAETLMHPRDLDDPFGDSVLRTRLLPRAELNERTDSEADASALGTAVHSAADLDALIHGFEQMYDFLMRHRSELLKEDSPLNAFAHLSVRYVLRNTKGYAAILRKLCHPKNLRCEKEWSHQLDTLSRARLSKAERESLERMDIPYFTTRTDSASLEVDEDTEMARRFKQPSYDAVLARVNRMNEDDRTMQIGLIRAAFDLTPLPPSLKGKRENCSPLLRGEELGERSFVDHAIAIARDLQQRAIYFADGSAHWIGAIRNPETQRYHLQAIGDDLYEGRVGVALFFAALAQVTGDAEWRGLALSALRGKEESNNIGGATGLGSIIYARVRCAQFLDEPSLIDDARNAAKQITRTHIADDRHFDVMDGVAGALLGLLALHKATGDLHVLDQAIACGEQMLAHRVDDGDGHPVWRGVDGNLWTGFPHGAAGIAYALLRLYAVTRNNAYFIAAEEAIAFERSVFSPAARNWPDWKPVVSPSALLRAFGSAEPSDAPVFEVRWCHGATGIGIARLGSLAIHDTCDTREEIAAALQTTLEYGIDEIDQLCCGNSGRIELLLTAAHCLNRPDLRDTARQWAIQIIDAASENSAYRLIPELPRGMFVPGFFRGVAGIGYTLLRLANPDALPSVLSWE